LLDTSAIINLQRNNADVKNLLATATDVFIPVVAVGELYFGAYKSQRVQQNHAAVVAFIANRVVLTVDPSTADVYGQIKDNLRAKGRPIPENDTWIAALALQYSLTLVTRDRHFAHVDNLNTVTW
jgi:tRNA(fMet)-specific endonuclease VapC